MSNSLRHLLLLINDEFTYEKTLSATLSEDKIVGYRDKIQETRGEVDVDSIGSRHIPVNASFCVIIG